MCDKGQRGREELGSMAIAYASSWTQRRREGEEESGEHSFHSSVPGQHLRGSGFYPQHHKDEKQNKMGTTEKTVFW